MILEELSQNNKAFTCLSKSIGIKLSKTMNLVKTIILLASLMSICFGKASLDSLSYLDLAKVAFSNTSTSPTYLVVNIFDNKDSVYVPTCVTSKDFNYKIGEELGTDPRYATNSQISEYFLSHKDLNFNLDIERSYSDSVLNMIRNDFEDLSRDSLIVQVCNGEIFEYIKNKSINIEGQWSLKEAIAHVYFEKKILLNRGCIGGGFYVSILSKKERRLCNKASR